MTKRYSVNLLEKWEARGSQTDNLKEGHKDAQFRVWYFSSRVRIASGFDECKKRPIANVVVDHDATYLSQACCDQLILHILNLLLCLSPLQVEIGFLLVLLSSLFSPSLRVHACYVSTFYNAPPCSTINFISFLARQNYRNPCQRISSLEN